MTERRRFTDTERAALYLDTDGTCAECGIDLDPGWHADHLKPYSMGGKTDVENGQALCPSCNLSKGASLVGFHDTFTPRPFQEQLIHTVRERALAGHRVTVALAAPGSGKTPGYQAVAVSLYRDSVIDLVAGFSPRVILARQAELSWMRDCQQDHLHTPACKGLHLAFDATHRLGELRHVPNRRPLTKPHERGVGFVTTYSALVTNPAIYEEWARKHAGRFLLIADEAQFCGSADERGSGTKAGALIESLSGLAAHTVLLTGTPYRADKQPLVLADYGEPGEDGRRHLDAHVRATYEDGVREGYLRPFEATFVKARLQLRKNNTDGTYERTELDLSKYEGSLRDVLRDPDVWRDLVDRVANAVREKRTVAMAYRGLISCMEMKDAKAAFNYVRKHHPDLRVMVATTEDGDDAERDLRSFQAGNGDILVTVRKAFIGYDCPEITVVGVLTHYRDHGHLMQLVGRGLRVWANGPEPREQTCRIVCPDDDRMYDFVQTLRQERDAGLKDRVARQAPEGIEGEGESVADDSDEYVEHAWATGAWAASNGQDVDADDFMLIEAAKRQIGISEDATKLAELISLMNVGPPSTPPVTPNAPVKPQDVPLTQAEQVEDWASRTRKVVASIASQYASPEDRSAFQAAVRDVNKKVAQRAGIWAGSVSTVEQAQRRYTAAREIQSEMSNGSA